MLTSPKKGKTAVHGCNPTLSVSVALASRKVNFLRSIRLAVFVFQSHFSFSLNNTQIPNSTFAHCSFVVRKDAACINGIEKVACLVE